MSRSDEFSSGYSNPAKRFYEWSSDNKCFVYYDKEKQANVKAPLPFNFIVLKTFHTIKGYNEEHNCGVYSNEVKLIGSEPLEVKTFKGGEKVEGLYKEIKDKIVEMGGTYHKSIYALTEIDGELTIINIAMKGAAVAAFGEFANEVRMKMVVHWVSVNEAESLKKGKVSYSTPIFTLATKLTSKDTTKADELYLELEKKEPSEREKDNAEGIPEVDDLPFD